eukprot:8174838-Alexandrium_andersonii.AAC.1
MVEAPKAGDLWVCWWRCRPKFPHTPSSAARFTLVRRWFVQFAAEGLGTAHGYNDQILDCWILQS